MACQQFLQTCIPCSSSGQATQIGNLDFSLVKSLALIYLVSEIQESFILALFCVLIFAHRNLLLQYFCFILILLVLNYLNFIFYKVHPISYEEMHHDDLKTYHYSYLLDFISVLNRFKFIFFLLILFIFLFQKVFIAKTSLISLSIL